MNKLLQNILELRRPAGGKGEAKLARSITGAYNGEMIDGNVHVRIGEGNDAVCFCAHLDTVHVSEGRQRLNVSGGSVRTIDGECLGADDGAGVYVLLQMIHAGVPGHYLFLWGEENGRHGAKAMQVAEPAWFRGIRWFIEFDRRGTDEVIWVQGWGETASEEDARSVCRVLGMGHKPSDRGIFTDNELWTEPGRACVNVSVGYEGAHTPSESLDLAYLERLVAACIAAPWSALEEPEGPDLYLKLGTWSGWDGEQEADYIELMEQYPYEVMDLLREMFTVEELRKELEERS